MFIGFVIVLASL